MSDCQERKKERVGLDDIYIEKEQYKNFVLTINVFDLLERERETLFYFTVKQNRVDFLEDILYIYLDTCIHKQTSNLWCDEWGLHNKWR